MPSSSDVERFRIRKNRGSAAQILWATAVVTPTPNRTPATKQPLLLSPNSRSINSCLSLHCTAYLYIPHLLPTGLKAIYNQRIFGFWTTVNKTIVTALDFGPQVELHSHTIRCELKWFTVEHHKLALCTTGLHAKWIYRPIRNGGTVVKYWHKTIDIIHI